MDRTQILLVGAGGHAAACIDVIEQHGRYKIAGLIGTQAETGGSVLGYPIVATDAELESLRSRYEAAFIAIGHIKSAELRVRVFDRLQALGYTLPTIVSPRAWVSPHAAVGEGTIVMHGAIVNARARVGRNCILNSQSLVEHDSRIADHCHVATAAVVNGDVTIDAGTFVGSRSSIRQGTRIGARCVIGMGQVVLTDCPDDATLPRSAT